MSKNIQIVQLREHDLNRGASKNHTPVFPITKASAIEGMSELLRDLNINGVTPTSDISDVNIPEKGKIYYEESTDKYYVYNEAQSNFVELGAGASVDPSDVMPTITQEASTQSGGDNIIIFTFPNGETDQVVIKNGQQGAQGNSGYTGAAGELEVVNNLEDGGEEKALSAEMGKDLKIQAFVEKGTFGDAYDKAKENSDVPFPWLLDDVDNEGTHVTKMIWHTGDGVFVDAIGTTVNGQKNGLTVVATAPCYMRVYTGTDAEGNKVIMKNHPKSYDDVGTKIGPGGYPPANIKGKTIADDYLLSVGENNFSLSEIAIYNETLDRYEVSTIVFVDTNEDQEARTTVKNTITSIDFGGLVLVNTAIGSDGNDNYTSYPPSPRGLLSGNTSIKSVKRLVVDGDLGGICINATNLEEIDISGVRTTKLKTLNGCSSLTKLDLSRLTFSGNGNIQSFLSELTNLVWADIRTVDTSEATKITSLCYRCNALKTLIIGNLSTENVTVNSSSFVGVTAATLVCTTTTPPVFNYDFVNGHFTSIKVPASAETAYKTNVLNVGDTVGTSGWSKYASIISTYEDGEY